MQMNKLAPPGLKQWGEIRSTYCVCVCAWIYVLTFMHTILSQPGTEESPLVCVKVCVLLPPHLHLEQPFGARI